MASSDSNPESSEDYSEELEEEDYGSDPDYHSGTDPSYSIEDDTSTKFHKLSIKRKSISSDEKDPDFGVEFSHVGNIIKDGRLEKLKLDECKVYLRKNGLRLSGNKDVLIQRIKEHFEVSNGDGEKKYPLSSFVVNCKGDACTGDVVMFEQNVYEMFSIASRSASGPPCGTRIVAGRIVKESYGTAKQQHTFTIQVLWSKEEKPLPPLHPLLIKGRNLYRLKTLRQKWEDEGERQRVLMEKHSRGSLARSDREVRIEEKERRKMLRSNRIVKREEKNSTSTVAIEIRSHQTVSSTNFGTQKQQSSSFTTLQSGFSTETQRLPVQPQSGYQNVCVCNGSQNQIPRDSLKNNAFQEVQLQNIAKLYMNNNQPNSIMNRNSTMSSKIIETNYCKEIPQLRNMNHDQPATLPYRQGFLSQQICRYHSQGRCYYGENYKFVHEQREFHASHVAEERRYGRLQVGKTVL